MRFVRKDHVLGGAFVVVGALVLAVSGDLPFGTLASPGAGMLPTLVIGLMMAFGLVLIVLGAASPALAEINWSDFPHAVRVVVVAAAATALYTQLGFLATVPLLLFALLFVVERKPILPALIFSIAVTAATHQLFTRLLKTPLPPLRRDLFGL
jgi:Tripartite tricarboxylate transporter TctB family